MEMWEGKLPKGWRSEIPGHNINKRGNIQNIKSYTYQAWFNMLVRCYTDSHPHNPKHYSDIRVCVRWVIGDGIKSGFLCYLEDMGERPHGTTAGRLGDAGNYEPGNVVWQTAKEQGQTRKKKYA